MDNEEKEKSREEKTPICAWLSIIEKLLNL